jgi:hypothetical protein
MIHARQDYNRIQDPALQDSSLLSEGSHPIGENEPVFLLRGQDKHFLPMLEKYIELCSEDKSMSDEQLKIVTQLLEDHEELATKWQGVFGSKSPTIPAN